MNIFMLFFCFVQCYLCANFSDKSIRDYTTSTKYESTNNQQHSSKDNEGDKNSYLRDSILFEDINLENILFSGMGPTDFFIERKGDTIFLRKLGYVGLEKAKIEFESDIGSSHLDGEIAYGISQMTHDDIPGFNFLGFSMLDIISIEKDDTGRFPVGQQIHNFKMLSSILSTEYFEEIRDDSYQFQLNFYRDKL